MKKFDFSHTRAEGAALGYPPCCTERFIRNCRKDTGFGHVHPKPQWKAGSHSGFIPCPRCASKVNKGKLRLEDLIQNRKVSWAFTDRWVSEFDLEKFEWDPLTQERMGELNRVAKSLLTTSAPGDGS